MIITVTNQKGGVAKTTTAWALGSAFKALKKSVLLIDFDFQKNLSLLCRATENAPTALEFLRGQVKPEHCQEGIIKAVAELAILSLKVKGPELAKALAAALEPMRKAFDVVIIDTPPNFNSLSLFCYELSDLLIIPTTPETLSLQALYNLGETLEGVARKPQASVLLTRCLGRNTKAQEKILGSIQEVALAAQFGIFKTSITEGTAVKEAQIELKPLHVYAPKCKQAQEYLDLARELEKTLAPAKKKAAPKASPMQKTAKAPAKKKAAPKAAAKPKAIKNKRG